MDKLKRYDHIDSRIPDDLVCLSSDVERLEAENERLKAAEKKAFWWSAEFIEFHNRRIQVAWETYKRLKGLNEAN